ncbi:unnamed protein product [Pedinophyceae sp. YPF-701]|nr:unnamed protein product [Pedinophyceae sp. YPF-701]
MVKELGELHFGGKGYKALIVAQHAGAQLKRADSDPCGPAGPSDALRALNPMGGRVPILETPDGPVFESNTIARYVALQTGSSLYPSGLDEPALQRAALIDGWVDSVPAKAGPALARVYAAAIGGADFDEDIYELKDAAIAAVAGVLEARLEASAYLAGGEPTLADVCAGVDLWALMTRVLEPSDREALPHTTAWFTRLAALPLFTAVMGPAALCAKTGEGRAPGAAASKSAAKKAAKAEAMAAKKEEAKRREKERRKERKAAEKGKGGAGGKGGGAGAAGKEVAKTTKLGLRADKATEFGEWYAQVVVEAEMISYYPVSGCYILRPWAFAQWQVLQEWFDAEIKKLEVQNCYFPLFVTPEVLQKEKDHVEGFAAEVAWVTRSGSSELEVPLAIRPTSETVMYPYFADWIKSHRDLPLKVNQWTNVVRWEFKHPTPFIRSREFLWQEGHTAHATLEEADREVLQILDLYRRVYEELLAVPVCPGRKSENEKFAGGLYTTTVEAFVPPVGKGIQGATSHCLGQNFAKMFDIKFSNDAGEEQLVWQNSWGFTTRTIGVMIMVHADNKGLVLPPRVAPKQAVIVPIPNAKLSQEQLDAMLAKCGELDGALRDAGVRATADLRLNYTPGWKYNHWELKGVPVRVEVGPRDLESGQVVLVRRDTGAKEPVAWAAMGARVAELLEQIQADMYAKARAEFDASMERVTEWGEFMGALDRLHMVLAPWDESVEVEEEIRKRSTTESAMGAKSLCIPFVQPELPAGTKCIVSGNPAKSWGLFGRSY